MRLANQTALFAEAADYIDSWHYAVGGARNAGDVEVIPEQQGWVARMQHTGNDEAVVFAARQSYRAGSRGLNDKDIALIGHLMNHRHTSPFEHCVLTVHVRAPLVVWWQWVRHRTFSYSLSSGRYTKFNNEEVMVPVEWRGKSETNKQGSAGPVDDEYQELLHSMWDKFSVAAVFNYTVATDNFGVAPEQARMFLPGFACMYDGMVTGNLYNWFHFVALREASEAQKEIQQYAKAVRNILMEYYPICYEAYARYMLPKYQPIEVKK